VECLAGGAAESGFPDGQRTELAQPGLGHHNSNRDQVGNSKPEIAHPRPSACSADQDQDQAGDHEYDDGGMRYQDGVSPDGWGWKAGIVVQGKRPGSGQEGSRFKDKPASLGTEWRFAELASTVTGMRLQGEDGHESGELSAGMKKPSSTDRFLTVMVGMGGSFTSAISSHI